uniref:Dilute domain-containing protein n=1 Tax=Cajanus cajan TaxID=3821 RepID=A0A151TU04_CAJCA|nr:hypothetical protein KK1_009782 [Cajanus cajan]
MKEIEKRKASRNSQTKGSRRTERRENKLHQDNSSKTLNEKGTESKTPKDSRPSANNFISDSNTATENSETYENVVIHYVDDVNSDLEKELKEGNEEVSDAETVKDSVSSVESSEADEKPVQDVKELDIVDGSSNGAQSLESEDESHETVNAKENGEHEDEAAAKLRIEEMESRIEKLEEELREVAALEVSLYSIAPEHGSSAHKVHTPARRLSRLYIHACKHWSQKSRATIAKNTVSGLILVAKSCGNDVSRLTFWLSNVIVLREIISQAFGNSLNGFMPLIEDWQETGTYIFALERVESWIFSRIVESVWWQALTPYMQSPVGDSSNKSIGRLMGPALGDHNQGNFSVNLWRNAFQDAFQRLCPVRAGGHECGCLPVLARMVMEQCIARLDVAMFNAILRESALEIPTDPISDPIVDSKVLPIPAGDLSFGSGAQLKNSVGNWSRWLTDMFGMDAEECLQEDQESSENDESQGGDREPKSFVLLNDLSDLLMLPKDMLMDRQIRQEVCPSISLSLVIRVLCNFTPDEFCPDPVPGTVLEALNAETIIERRLSTESVRSFPYVAAPVVYMPPSSANVAEKVAEAGGKSHLERNVSAVQRRGYTSDEELEELDSPLTSIIDKLPSSPTVTDNGKGNNHKVHPTTNARYQLLREVWSM